MGPKKTSDPNAQCSAIIDGKRCERLVGEKGRTGKCNPCYKKYRQSLSTVKCKAKGHFDGADWSCNRKAQVDSSSGYCDGHERQQRRGLSIRPLKWDTRRKDPNQICSVRIGDWKCQNPVNSYDLCKTHGAQKRDGHQFTRVRQYVKREVDPMDAKKVEEIKELEGEDFTAWVKDQIKTGMVTGDFDPSMMREWKDHVDREEGKAASRSVVRTMKEIPLVEIRVMALDPKATLDHIVPVDD